MSYYDNAVLMHLALGRWDVLRPCDSRKGHDRKPPASPFVRYFRLG